MKWIKHHPFVCTFFSWASCGVTASKPFKASKLSGKKTSDGIWFLMIFLRPVRCWGCRHAGGWLQSVRGLNLVQSMRKHVIVILYLRIPQLQVAFCWPDALCILLIHDIHVGGLGAILKQVVGFTFAYIWPLQTLVSRAKSDTMPVDPNPAMFGTGPADGMTNGGRGDSRAFEPPYHGTIQAIPGHSLIICYCC